MSLASRLFLLFALLTLSSSLWAGDTKKNVADVIRSAKSGAWSDSATWQGGKVPTAGSRVQIREGHTVVYDVKAAEVIRFVHVAGTLSFAPDKDTQLNVGLIKIQAGDSA